MPYKTQLLELPNELWEWVARAIGAMLGSAISLAYFLPATKREAALRFLTGLGVGLVFGTLTGHKLTRQLGLEDALTSMETTLIGATTASLCAWWGLGILARIANRYGGSSNNSEKKKAS